MQQLGRFLQMVGLILVPMALLYFGLNRGTASEARLMFGELTILGVGSGIFLLGRRLATRS